MDRNGYGSIQLDPRPGPSRGRRICRKRERETVPRAGAPNSSESRADVVGGDREDPRLRGSFARHFTILKPSISRSTDRPAVHAPNIAGTWASNKPVTPRPQARRELVSCLHRCVLYGCTARQCPHTNRRPTLLCVTLLWFTERRFARAAGPHRLPTCADRVPPGRVPSAGAAAAAARGGGGLAVAMYARSMSVYRPGVA